MAMLIEDRELPELAAEVKRGAALLDAKLPGWRNVLKARLSAGMALDMGNCQRCVLGHVVGDYLRGLDKLGMKTDASVRHGFNVPDGLDTGTMLAAYDRLGELWIAEVQS